MKIRARGWNRNMGHKTLGNHALSEMRTSKDPNKGVFFDEPGLFRSFAEVSVAWGQELHLTGKYRVQIDFTRSDIIKLFKAMFGSELDMSLVTEHGFTISDDLQKQILSKMKLADLTIGDLANLGVSAKKDDKAEDVPATIKSFRRRF